MIQDIALFPIKFLVKVFKFHKLKVLLFTCCTALFFLTLFPYGDLADLISSVISKQTRGNIHVQFDDISLSFIPSPGVELVDPQVATKSGLQLNLSSLELNPSVMSSLIGLIKSGFKPQPKDLAAGSITAKNLLKGNLELDVSQGKKIGDDVKGSFKKVHLEFDNIDLKEIKKVFPLPVKLHGKAQGKISPLNIDPSFTVQPNGEITINISQLKIPATAIDTQMGPLNLPTLSFKTVQLKGRLVDRELIIEEGQFGGAKDPLNAKIKAKVNLSVIQRGRGISVEPGRYDFKVQMNASKQMQKDLAIAFILFDKFKKTTPTGAKYSFQAKGRRMGRDTPNFLPLSKL